MNKPPNGCWAWCAGCAFSLWGMLLNAYISSWLLHQHYGDAWGKHLEGFYSSLLNGLFGYFTGYYLITKSFKIAFFSGVILGCIAAILFILEWLSNTGPAAIGNYTFAILWSLLLVTIGVLKRRETDNS